MVKFKNVINDNMPDFNLGLLIINDSFPNDKLRIMMHITKDAYLILGKKELQGTLNDFVINAESLVKYNGRINEKSADSIFNELNIESITIWGDKGYTVKKNEEGINYIPNLRPIQGKLNPERFYFSKYFLSNKIIKKDCKELGKLRKDWNVMMEPYQKQN